MKDEGFTLITCSYNTPIVTLCMLKSYCKYHSGVHRLILIENSTNTETCQQLDQYNVPYIKGADILTEPKQSNWAWTHYCGLDWAVNNCNTPYCIIVDTDILFRDNIYPYIIQFLKNPTQYVAMGTHTMRDKPEIDADYYMLPRIHPSFMILNVDYFNKTGLTFDPYVEADIKSDECLDVGSYIYYKLIRDGKQTINIDPNKRRFIHSEGLSWAKTFYQNFNRKERLEKLEIYDTVVYNDLSEIDITDRYTLELNI
jgi:hypothetical protein